MTTIVDVQSFIATHERASRHVKLHHSELSGLVSREPAVVANEIVQRWGYGAINPQSWSVVDGAAAAAIARRLLGSDLAYKSELIREETAEYLAERLVGALSRFGARFVCNAEFHGTSVSWDPIGPSTFEAALVGFDESCAFLLYAEAED
ncbi:hypothetical protein AACH06_29800 [Ideonella sp. DXS29W]|uniref:Uncharacterized protein n=1 Tax=Ideonella lacteola TaxID=2984193 RepID=A0ABU9BYP9_9BURK